LAFTAGDGEMELPPDEFGDLILPRFPKPHDSRLPPPGAWLERNYRGQRIAIKVRIDGFEFEGHVYKTLTTAVNQATGGRWNGFAFFGLPAPGEVNHAQE
jgi:hypothetical protein